MGRSKNVLCALLALALLLGNACTVSAAEWEAGFGVWPVLPENQIDAEAPYFFLHVEPGQEQILRIQLTNSYDHDITLSLEANTAFSSGSGLIAYTRSEHRDPSLAADFSTLVTVPEPAVTMPAHSQVTAEVILKMPDEPLEGEMLGGIVVAKLPDEKSGSPENGAMITNVYTYVIAVRVRQGDVIIEPELEVLGVREGAVAGGPTLEIDIRNPKPLILKDIVLDVTVRSAGTGEPALRFTADNLDMAPNSMMSFAKLLFGESLSPGSYQVDSRLSGDESTWEFTSPLEIGE